MPGNSNPLPAAKDERLQALRGLAILLVVWLHVVGSTYELGYRLPSLLYFCDSLVDLRMPLFAAISGFVYALNPVTSQSRTAFLIGKCRRILMPFVVVSTLHFLLRMVVPGTRHSAEIHNLWRIYCFRFDHYWFLEASMLIFLAVALIDCLRWMRSLRGWLACLAVAVCASFFSTDRGYSDLFCWQHALYLLPFFLIGCGVCRFASLLSSGSALRIMLTVMVAGVTARQLFLHTGLLPEPLTSHLIALYAGMGGCALLLRFRVQNRPFAWLGSHAYPIFLFHMMSLSACRIISERAGITSPYLFLVFGTLCGLGAPLILENLLSRHGLTRRLFLGLK